jgi:WD40 repeat protein
MPSDPKQARPAADARPPPAVADHELLARIGEGAYGEVWLARNVTGAFRAVKIVYRYRFADDRPYEREFKGITRFEPISRSNEGLVDILQVGRDEQAGCFYYVMELADCAGAEKEKRRKGDEENDAGAPALSPLFPSAPPPLFSPATYAPKTLQSELRHRSRLPYDECLQLGLSLTLALAHLHRHGLIHRDIKPSNIIFVGGVPKLADIGLVTETAEARSYVGTEGFIPPEGPNSPQADIFSLGKVLYEISMGKDRQDFPEPFTQLAEDPAAEALLELNAVMLKACANERDRRYQSAEEMHADLALLHSGRSVKRKRVIEQRLAWMTKAGAIAATLALLASGAYVFQRHQTAEIERLAQQEALQRHRAETAFAQADESLVRLEMQRAEEAFSSDRAALGLAELARVLRHHPTNRIAAERIWSAVSQRNFLVPALPSLLLDTNVTVAQFAPDGRLVFVAARDGTARLWDTRAGHLAASPPADTSAVVRATFTPDGNHLLTLSRNDVVRFWDVARAQPSSPPLVLTPAVLLAEFSGDGRRLVTTLANHRVRVWDLNARAVLRDAAPAAGAITDLRFSHNGEFFAIVASNRAARVWSVRSDQPLTPPLKHSLPILSLAFSPDDRWLVTASEDRTAQIWETQTGRRLGPALRHDNWVSTVHFSPDGSRVVTGSADRTAQVWDARTTQAIGPPIRHENQVVLVRFSPEGRRVLTVTRHNQVRLWDAFTGQPLTEPFSLPDSVQAARFSDDGERLMIVARDRRVRLLDVRPAGSLSRALYAPNYVIAASFSPDGGRLAIGDRGHSARLWNLRTNPPSAIPMRHREQLNSVEFSPDGRWLVTASEDETARVWDATSGQPVTPPLVHTGRVMFAQFDHESSRVVTASADGSACVWDARTGQQLGEPLRHEATVYFAEFSPDGGSVATASADGAARVWSLRGEAAGNASRAERGKGSRGEWPPHVLRHNDAVNEVHFSADGTKLVTSAGDGTARVWDARTGQAVSPPLKHNNEVWSAAFNPDGSRVVTASLDGTARLWDATSGLPLTEPLQHDGAVDLARFSPDGRRVVTASRDGSARIWDANTGRALSEPLRHESRVYSARFSGDGRWVVTGSRDRTARLWETPPPAPERSAPVPGRRNPADTDGAPAAEDAGTSTIAAWVPALAEAVGGQHLGAQRILSFVDEAEYWRLREEVNKSTAADPYTLWAKWFFAERSRRAISPGATMNLADLERACLESDSRERVEEWLRLVPNHPLALARLAHWELADGSAPVPGRGDAASTGDASAAEDGRTPLNARPLAEWWSRHATTRAPRSAAVWTLRAELLKKLNDTSNAVTALQRALDLEAKPELWLKQARWLAGLGDNVAAGEACSAGIALATNTAGCPPELADKLRLQRVNVRRLQGRDAEALAELASVKPFPPRDPGTPPNLVDLTLCYNARLDESWHRRTDVGNNLADLPAGMRTFGGVSFDARGIIQLAGGGIKDLEPDYPEQVTGIRIGRACRRIHFLHGTGWIVSEGTLVAQWVMRFADGQRAVVPIVYGPDVRNWQFWPRMSAEDGGAEPVWKGTQARWKKMTGIGVRLYKSTWENPRPDAVVASIDLISAQAASAPFLLAITVD